MLPTVESRGKENSLFPPCAMPQADCPQDSAIQIPPRTTASQDKARSIAHTQWLIKQQTGGDPLMPAPTAPQAWSHSCLLQAGRGVGGTRSLCSRVTSSSSTSLLPYLPGTCFTHLGLPLSVPQWLPWRPAATSAAPQPARAASQQTAPDLPHRTSGEWRWGCLGSEVTFWGMRRKEDQKGQGLLEERPPPPPMPAPVPAPAAASISPQLPAAVLHRSSPSLSAAGAPRPEPLSFSCQHFAPVMQMPRAGFARCCCAPPPPTAGWSDREPLSLERVCEEPCKVCATLNKPYKGLFWDSNDDVNEGWSSFINWWCNLIKFTAIASLVLTYFCQRGNLEMIHSHQRERTAKWNIQVWMDLMRKVKPSFGHRSNSLARHGLYPQLLWGSLALVKVRQQFPPR